MEPLPPPRVRRLPERGRPWSWLVLARSLAQARWIALAEPRAPRPAQLVVCGFPRAGTSLLYNMLSSALTGFTFTSFETSALNCLWRYENLASKSPMDVFNVPLLARDNFLSKRILCLVLIRDVRDVITSVHPNLPDRYFCGYADRWRIVGTHPYLADSSPWGIREFTAAIDTALATTGLGIEMVRYETLVADPDAVQRALAERYSLTFTTPFSSFHRHPERHAYRYEGETRPKDPSLVRESAAVTDTRVERWRRPEHRERIREQFTTHPELFEVLRRYAWERDDLWFRDYA